VEHYAREVGKLSAAQILLAQADRISKELAVATATTTDASGKQGVGASASQQQGTSSGDMHVHQSVLGTLAELLQAYVEQIGRLSASYANLAGRSAANANDVMLAIDDVSPITNSTIRDIALYSIYEEVAFPSKIHTLDEIRPTSLAVTVPAGGLNAGTRLPLSQPLGLLIRAGRGSSDTLAEKLKRAIADDNSCAPTLNAFSSTQSAGNGTAASQPSAAFGAGPHMEPWMPPLPPPHSYIHTPVFAGSTHRFNEQQRPTHDAATLARQRRQGESSFVKLSAAKRARPAEENPFWANPRLLDAHDSTKPAVREPIERDDRLEPRFHQMSGAADRAGTDMDPKVLNAERILAESTGLEHEG